MTDISPTVIPKSDQLNADDLITGDKVLKITGVKVVSGDQSLHIFYEGGDGKPYKPCKSMRRVFLLAWGSNADKFIGRYIKVYNDVNVKWAGEPVGGIRIKEMSDITDMIIPLTISKGKKIMWKVKQFLSNWQQKTTIPEVKKLTLDKNSDAWNSAIEFVKNGGDVNAITKKYDVSKELLDELSNLKDGGF